MSFCVWFRSELLPLLPTASTIKSTETAISCVLRASWTTVYLWASKAQSTLSIRANCRKLVVICSSRNLQQVSLVHRSTISASLTFSSSGACVRASSMGLTVAELRHVDVDNDVIDIVFFLNFMQDIGKKDGAVLQDCCQAERPRRRLGLAAKAL